MDMAVNAAAIICMVGVFVAALVVVDIAWRAAERLVGRLRRWLKRR